MNILNLPDTELAALTRRALEAMERRGWTVKRWSSGEWGVTNYIGDWPHALLGYNNNSQADPITAIVAADEWLKRDGR